MICSSYFLDKETHTHVTNLIFPQVDVLLTAEQVSSTSKRKNLETSYWFNCKSLVEEWTELDDFPSSEDLSVFLADLDTIAITKFHPSLRTPCTKDSLLTKLSETQGGTSLTLRSNDLMMSQTFKDVLCNVSQTAESDDFLPSEDLYAVLADMELGCDNIPVKMSSPPANNEVKALLSRVSCTKHKVDDIIERDVVHMKHTRGLVARNNKEWADWNKSLSARFEFSITTCQHVSKGKGHDDKSSGSRIMMNCKRVLSELFEDDSSRNENSIGSSLANELAEGIHEHTRKTEQLFFFESPKEDVNEMSLEHEKNRVQLYDFSTNETNLRNSTRSGKQSSDDETNSEANLSGYDLSISTSPVLFSQSVSRMEGESYSKTQEPLDDASPSCCTPDLFPSLRIPSDYTRSFSGQKMNSAPLFSCSENSFSSDSFRALVASPPAFSTAIADPLLIKSTFQFQNQFHSTPMLARLPSRIECQASSQILYSPLIPGTPLCNEISFQGSPILFSPMSDTSC